MKKNYLFLCLILILAFCLCSCETTVSIRTLTPAKVNLASYDNIGIVSTEPFDSSWSDFNRKYKLEANFSDRYIDYFAKEYGTSTFGLNENLSRYASNVMLLAVRNSSSSYDKGFLIDNLVNSARRTGSTVKSTLERNGVDAVITSSITGQSLREYLEAKPYTITTQDNKVLNCYKLYLVRKARLELSYNVVDVKKNMVISSSSYEDSEEREYYLGYREGDYEFQKGRDYYLMEDGSDLFKKILDRIGKKVTDDFSQSFSYSYFSLQESANPDVERGIEFADFELYEEALELFESAWRKTGSFESGYNAAVMYFALGDYDMASEMAYNTWISSMDVKAKRLYEKFQSLAANDVNAKKQLGIIDNSADAFQETELVGF